MARRGLSKRELWRVTRRLLACKQRELRERGIHSIYGLGAVRADNGEYWTTRVLRASNGEVAVFLACVPTGT